MVKKRQERIEVTRGTGNVFADLGFAEPEEEATKAHLLMLIQQTLRRRRLSQTVAAVVMGIDQPKVSALLKGRGANFSSARLMRLLTRLGQDVDVTVRMAPRGRKHGRIRIVVEART